MNRLTFLASAAIACLLATPVFAASSATAKLDNIQVTLSKLDPLLAGTPSIIFTGSGSDFAYASAANYDVPAGSMPYGYGTGFQPLAFNTSGVSNAWASGQIAGSGSVLGSSLSASGAALGTTSGEKRTSFQVSLSAVNQSFSLSANTVALFSVESSLSATVTANFDPATSHHNEAAGASNSLYVTGPDAFAGGYQQSGDSHSIYAQSLRVTDASCVYGYCYVGQSMSDSTGLSASFTNATASTLDGYMHFYTDVSGYSFSPLAAAVPEPSSYALMLAGLAAIGFIVRRRVSAK